MLCESATGYMHAEREKLTDITWFFSWLKYIQLDLGKCVHS
jgi:hypothetical protein